MRVTHENLKCCVDCLMYIANGELSEGRPDLKQEIAARWPHGNLVPSGPENEEGHFSWRPCECCGSRLGGDRYLFSILEA